MGSLRLAFNMTKSIVNLARGVSGRGFAGRDGYDESKFEAVINQEYYKSMRTEFPNRNGEIENIIRESEPGFSAEVFVAYAKEVFNKLESALSGNDMTPVRDYMGEELFGALSKKARADLINGNRHLRLVEADTAYLTSYERSGEAERLAVYLTVKKIDWKNLDKRDKIEIEGVLSKEKVGADTDTRYRLKFERGVSGGEWKLCRREAVRYNTFDEGVKVI